MVSSLTCSGLAPTLTRTAATSLPTSRSRAHASRARPPVAFGIVQNPSCVPERMRWQYSSFQFVVLALKSTNWRAWSGHKRGLARRCNKGACDEGPLGHSRRFAVDHHFRFSLEQRTSSDRPGMSQKCHIRTFVPQQTRDQPITFINAREHPRKCRALLFDTNCSALHSAKFVNDFTHLICDRM